MSMPFYVSPEQLMQDRAEFARKGILRGRSVLVASVAAGIVFVAENRSASLHKVSEIHDRIGFAAVGRYHEFEALRVAGIRQADLRGWAYDRRDVTARSLAGDYSQLLGSAFASADKPFEVELVVAELGTHADSDRLFHVTYDGTVAERSGLALLGREALTIAEQVRPALDADLGLPAAVRLAAAAISENGTLGAGSLEVAVLERGAGTRRTFRRITADELDAWLGETE